MGASSGPTENLEPKSAMSSCPRTPQNLLKEQGDDLPNCGPEKGLGCSRKTCRAAFSVPREAQRYTQPK